ncbi:MAG TPA: acyl carrier protein [Clostridiales bacterium]|nr:acyl carrier protein [Clostridiales bacterium]
MDILAEINEIANEYVGDVNLKLDDTFDSLDFDSLDVVQIAMAVEKKYGIKFPDKIEAKTVGDLVKMVEELTK